MKHIIEHEVLKQQDITMEHEQMPNGENRFRIKTTDNSMVSFCKSEKISGWQNAHYHKNLRELYIVQTGEVILVIQDKENKIDYHLLHTGETYMVEPDVKHNVYLLEGASTCVIKFGAQMEKDWFPAIELDKICKSLAKQVS